MARRSSRRMPSLVTVENLARLQGIPSGELTAMQSDLYSRMHMHGATVTKLRVEAEAINAVLRSRGKPQYEISDHAVVRWLQKVKGFDVEAIRLEIAEKVAKAASGSPGVICRAKGDAVEYSLDGVNFIVARHNCVVTVHIGVSADDGQ